MAVIELWDDRERRELYRILRLRDKLADGQAFIEVRRTGNFQPEGDFPAGTRSQIVNIRLQVNHYRICVAHRYVIIGGSGWNEWTEPDPKSIFIDDLAVKESPKEGSEETE